ncbi:hypothetical protein ACFQRC_04355 [Enterovirga sp. GCM10030262]|uniref:hypothetical protein n=1 Tax=Enterovirga sp. GCM10030262 TaxID=3273391 RepID=UPI00361E671A
MRSVERSAKPAPASLTGDNSTGGKELAKARKHYTTVPLPKKAPSPRAYKGDDVRSTLEALFHGKCAYCETRYDVTGPVDIEHFRPKKGIDGEPAHLGYWWLAAVWTNLLPSCIDCNRRRRQPTPIAVASLTAALEASRNAFKTIHTGKETCFPVAGTRVITEPAPADAATALAAEDALLLDPCVDSPAKHLRYYIDRDRPLGLVFAAAAGAEFDDALPLLSASTRDVEAHARAAGISARGAVSIQVYGLNRLALVQERTRILRRLEFMADMVVSLSSTADQLEAIAAAPADADKLALAVVKLREVVARTLAEIKSMAEPAAPFSAMVSAWLEDFRRELAA